MPKQAVPSATSERETGQNATKGVAPSAKVRVTHHLHTNGWKADSLSAGDE